MNATLSLAAAIDSADCDWPGCAYEAETQGRCRYHVGRTPVPRQGGDPERHGRLVPGALAHLMDDVDDEPAATTPKETPVQHICKIDGCTNPTAGKGGPWKNYCQQHMSEEIARRHAVRRANAPKAVKPPPAKKQQAPPAPPVAAAAQPVPEARTAGKSLVDLAQAVQDASAAIADATELHARSVAALRAALDEAA